MLRSTLLLALWFPQLFPGETHAGDFNTKNKPRSHSQVAGSPRATLLNINNMTMWAGDDGTLERKPDESAGVQFPRGTTTAIFAGGLLWGGVVVDGSGPAVRVGGQTFSKGTTPGGIIHPGVPESAANTDVRIYRVRHDWVTADLRKDAAEYYGIPEFDVTVQLMDALRLQYQKDWTEWPWQKGAPYYERNGIPGYQPPTGTKYDPTDDEPGLGGADQVIWYVANDLDNATALSLYGSPSIGIEQQVTCWAYSSRPELQNVIFQRHRLIYKGTATTLPTATISPMYIAKWVDADIGEFTDDLAGSDTVRSLGYAFNGNTNDIEYDKSNLVPPAVGYDLLQGPRVPKAGGTAHWDLKTISGYTNLPMTTFTYFTGDTRTTDYDIGLYRGTQEWYNLMRGYRPIPLTPLQCLTDPTTGQCTKFEISGDAELFRGWVDGRSDTSGDRRFAMITGPFSMALGDTQEVVYSLMGAIGSHNRQSVGELLKVDDFAQDAYNLNFELIDTLPSPPLRIVELDKAFIFDWESDTAGVHRVESYYSKGFRFETYNIYQFASPTATLDRAIPFPPFDVALPRSMNIDKDLLRNHALVNGQKYYYAVTAQYYNPDPLVAIPRIESPLRILTATPHSPNAGIVYPYQIGEPATNSSSLRHVNGFNDATITTSFYDPSRTEDHTYKFRFHRSPDVKILIEEKPTWDLIDFSEYSKAWALGGDAASGGAVLIRSQDGGVSWEPDIRPGTGQLRAISFADVQSGYGVGESGLILRTTNGGESWANLTSGTTKTLFGVHMLDYNFISAVGANGALLTSSNGGATWRTYAVPVTDTLWSTSFYDSYRGFVAGNQGVVMHTSDGGVWVGDAIGTTEPIFGVSYSDINYAYAVGGNGTIRRSRGLSGIWDALTSPTSANLRAVNFLDGRTGTVVGDGGVILKTTDRGGTWVEQNSGTTNDLFSVSFSDSLTGVVCGASGTLLQTTDAGATWVTAQSGTVHSLRSVSASKELHLLDSLRVDTPTHRVISRAMHVNVRQPLYGMKGVFEVEHASTPVRRPVFNQSDPAGKYLVVGKGASDLDTIRGGNASDADLEVRFNGDSSWAVFRRTNAAPTATWVRVPYTVWGIGIAGKDSFAVQFYSVITEQGGDSIWRPATILDHPYNGQSVKYFYPITIVNDTFFVSENNYLGRYNDSIPYLPASNITKAYLVVTTQSKDESKVGIWKAYIGDLDNDGVAAPRGTTIRFERFKYIVNRDEILFTPSGLQTGNLSAEEEEMAKINVFPNPYYGMNRAEVDRSQRFVTFNHLPAIATIRIFNLAGTMVRTIRKDDDTQFVNWDLNNERALPVAAGIYLAYLELRDRQGRDLGTKTLKLMIVPEVAQHASE